MRDRESIILCLRYAESARHNEDGSWSVYDSGTPHNEIATFPSNDDDVESMLTEAGFTQDSMRWWTNIKVWKENQREWNRKMKAKYVAAVAQDELDESREQA